MNQGDNFRKFKKDCIFKRQDKETLDSIFFIGKANIINRKQPHFSGLKHHTIYVSIKGVIYQKTLSSIDVCMLLHALNQNHLQKNYAQNLYNLLEKYGHKRDADDVLNLIINQGMQYKTARVKKNIPTKKK